MANDKKVYKRDAEQTEVTLVGDDMDSTPVQQTKPLPARVKPKMSFDAWWVMAQRATGLKASMKMPVYKHLKARGFLASGDFNAGLKDFGVKE